MCIRYEQNAIVSVSPRNTTRGKLKRRYNMRITEDTTIGDLIDEMPEAKEILAEMGLHCSSCPSARRETLKQAAEVHDMDIDDFLEDLKGFLEG